MPKRRDEIDPLNYWGDRDPVRRKPPPLHLAIGVIETLRTTPAGREIICNPYKSDTHRITRDPKHVTCMICLRIIEAERIRKLKERRMGK